MTGCLTEVCSLIPVGETQDFPQFRKLNALAVGTQHILLSMKSYCSDSLWTCHLLERGRAGSIFPR